MKKVLVPSLILLAATSLGWSTSYYWDTNGNTSGVGGTGIWNTTNTFWNPLSNGTGTPIAWTQSTGDVADFRGTAGTVTVSGTQTLSGLSINAAGYVLNGGTLDLYSSGSSLDITNSVGGTTEINSNLNFAVAGGTNSLRIRNLGTGELTLGGTLSASESRSITLQAGGSVVNNTAVIRFSGSVGGSNITQLSFGGLPGSSSSTGATYYVSGDNSALTGGTSGIITSGTVVAENNLAFGSGNVQVGDNATVAVGPGGANLARLLTGGAYTIANNINIGRQDTVAGPSDTVRVVGGNTADNSSFTGNVTIRNQGTNQFTAAADGRVTFSGLISTFNPVGFTGTTQGIEKVGGGTVVFSRGAGNTYMGGTTVSAGTLLVNNTSNSGTGDGAVSVTSGGTLGGTGRIAPGGSAGITVSSGGAIAPGDGGIGTLTMNLGGTTGTASFLSGSSFSFDLGAGLSSDVLAFTGLSANVADVLFNGNALNFTGSNIAVGVYTLFTFDQINAYSGTLGTITGPGPGYVANWIYNGSDIQLEITAVPEPSSAALLLAGAFVAFRARFSRRK